MALVASLVTNEVKDRASAEVEFTRLGGDGRSTIWAKVNEEPAFPQRITLSHQEIGEGSDRRRRSILRVDLTHTGEIDAAAKSRKTSAYKVVDVPIGDVSNHNHTKDALAYLDSLSATLASSTILLDGTGNGNAALIAGSVV